MQNRYMPFFSMAKKNYSEQKSRLGYPKGMLTWLRHNSKKNQTVAELEEKIKETDDIHAKEIIENHLSLHPFNNHSFNAYFFDELVSVFPNDEWQKFNPKPIIFYQGTLFRGTSFAPDVVFEKGFSDYNPSKSLDDYVSDCNGSVGISTSKSYRVAAGYALPSINRRDFDTIAKDVHTEGYVYEINYRGHVGIDIEATQLQRGNSIRAACAKTKKEVNIIDRIKACDIVRAWRLTRRDDKRSVFENKLYQSERKTDDDDFSPRIIVHSRDYLFSSQEKKSSLIEATKDKSPRL